MSPTVLALKILTALLVALWVRGGDLVFFSFYFAFIMSHYLLGIASGLSRARALRPHLPLAILALATSAVFVSGVPDMVFVFSLHFAFSEVLAFSAVREGEKEGRTLAGSRILLWTFGFLFMIRGSSLVAPSSTFRRVQDYLPGELSFAAFFAFAVAVFWMMLKRRSPRLALWHESLVVAGVLLSLRYSLSFHVVVCYHVMTWVWLPVLRRRPSAGFMAASIGLFLLFFALTPLAGGMLALRESHLGMAIYIGGVLHVMSTFALSRHNPQWLQNALTSASSPVRSA